MSQSRIIIRADGSPTLGMGHIMRCLRLAKTIAEKRHSLITFATTTPEYYENNLRTIYPDGKIRSVSSTSLNETLDFYSEYKPHCVISDVNFYDRIDDYIEFVEKIPFHVNIHEMHFNHFYFGLVIFATVIGARPRCACETKAEYFAGPMYLMVDPRLASLQIPEFEKDRQLRVLISPGGADPGDITGKVLDLIEGTVDLKSAVRFKLVVGPANIRKSEIASKSEKLKDILQIIESNDLYELISDSDLVITNGGTTVYETIAAGRPSWVIPQNEFEAEVGKVLKNQNAVIGTGIASLASDFLSKISQDAWDPENFKTITQNGRKLIDGKGIQRISDKIVKNLGAIKI